MSSDQFSLYWSTVDQINNIATSTPYTRVNNNIRSFEAQIAALPGIKVFRAIAPKLQAWLATKRVKFQGGSEEFAATLPDSSGRLHKVFDLERALSQLRHHRHIFDMAVA